ncbi:MAG: Gfo/Idh/MocA family oxidoreductase [Verrucomicrobia bacterium]|nr:Gfo/Idh/MocA family oxidoreductase [Verrucomicrobiota bacterium]
MNSVTRSSAFSRRSFLKATLATGVSAPFITRDLLARPPSEQVLHASFGAGGMAWADLTSIASHPKVKMVAVAEVDAGRAAEFRKKFPEAKVYDDYRVLLEKEKLDSVNVSTPDHMHAPMGLAALQRGLAVYGQKPLTHDVAESRKLTELARKKGVVTQMGIQVHSSKEYRTAIALVHQGAIGKVREVHTWSSKDWGDLGAQPTRTDPIPAGFNWDLWLGVAAPRPFIGNGWYHPGNWRRRLDFGTGTFGDMGCHIFDPVFGALELTAPLSVRSEGLPPNAHSWANNAVIQYVFPGTRQTVSGSVPITWYDGNQRPPAEVRAQLGGRELPDQGSILLGTEGVLIIPHVAMPILLPDAKFKGFKLPEIEGVDHWHQFVNAIRGEGKTSTGFDYSGPLTESILLGGVATRFPKITLNWDAAGLKFSNVTEANAYIQRPYRAGWQVAGV